MELNKKRALLVKEGADQISVNKAYNEAKAGMLVAVPTFVEIPLEYGEEKEYQYHCAYPILGVCQDPNSIWFTDEGVYV
jgi:hypothetical protein